MTTRDRIAAYLQTNPDSTVREIQSACEISSPSVVHYHLERMAVGARMKCPHCEGKGHIRAFIDKAGK